MFTRGGYPTGGRDRRSKLLWLAVFCLLFGLRAIQFVFQKKERKKLFLISKFDMKNKQNLEGNSRCWFCLTAAGLLEQLQSRHSNRRWQQFEDTTWTAYFCSNLAVCVASNLLPLSLQILRNYKNAELDFQKLCLPMDTQTPVSRCHLLSRPLSLLCGQVCLRFHIT